MKIRTRKGFLSPLTSACFALAGLCWISVAFFNSTFDDVQKVASFLLGVWMILFSFDYRKEQNG